METRLLKNLKTPKSCLCQFGTHKIDTTITQGQIENVVIKEYTPDHCVDVAAEADKDMGAGLIVQSVTVSNITKQVTSNEYSGDLVVKYYPDKRKFIHELKPLYIPLTFRIDPDNGIASAREIVSCGTPSYDKSIAELTDDITHWADVVVPGKFNSVTTFLDTIHMVSHEDIMRIQEIENRNEDIKRIVEDIQRNYIQLPQDLSEKAPPYTITDEEVREIQEFKFPFIQIRSDYKFLMGLIYGYEPLDHCVCWAGLDGGNIMKATSQEVTNHGGEDFKIEKSLKETSLLSMSCSKCVGIGTYISKKIFNDEGVLLKIEATLKTTTIRAEVEVKCVTSNSGFPQVIKKYTCIKEKEFSQQDFGTQSYTTVKNCDTSSFCL